MDVDLNALWCRAIAEEIQRAGVRRAVLCPGSRNSPLLFALAHALGGWDGTTGCLSQSEERSAGFIALGMVKATGEAAAVCVTSGSALANLAPVLAEAKAASLPLVVIAADRPWELHGVGAPQTMPQRGAFSAFLVDEPAIGEPVADDLALRSLRARVSRAAQARGPVLINVPLREPLLGPPGSVWAIPDGLSAAALLGRGQQPFTLIARTAVDHAEPLSTHWLRPGLRGVIVAGPGAMTAPAAGVLARALGYPLIADACSGARQPVESVTTADALLTGPLADAEPELIIVHGAMPLARAVYEWIDRQRCPLLTIGQAPSDHLARAWVSLPDCGGSAAAALLAACAPGDPAWRERWISAERTALQRLDEVMAAEPWGEVLAAHLAFAHQPPAIIHAASSMPIRHANLHARGNVLANRGVNGIDGTIGTFLGEILATGQPGRLVCGDLAFLHDLPALAAAGTAPGSAIVVLNNDGGGIFDFLPVARMPDYERWVRTPHGRDCAGAAAQFGLAYAWVASRAALIAAFDAAATAPGLSLIECVVPGNAVERHRSLLRRMATP